MNAQMRMSNRLRVTANRRSLDLRYQHGILVFWGDVMRALRSLVVSLVALVVSVAIAQYSPMLRMELPSGGTELTRTSYYDLFTSASKLLDDEAKRQGVRCHRYELYGYDLTRLRPQYTLHGLSDAFAAAYDGDYTITATTDSQIQFTAETNLTEAIGFWLATETGEKLLGLCLVH